MTYKHSCVIDADCQYKTLVLIILGFNEAGKIQEHIQYYRLQDGEQVIDVQPPTMRPQAGATGLIKPRWDDNAETWVEAATGAEITAWELEHPAPEPRPMTVTESLLDTVSELDYRLSLHQLGIEEV